MSSTDLTLTIDGRAVTVPARTTIWEAARQNGIDIPALCHDPRMDPVGVCRMCVVDVGERVLAASCARECADGMTVDSASETVEGHRRMLTELLLSEYPETSAREETTRDDALLALADRYDLPRSEPPRIGNPVADLLETHASETPHSALRTPHSDTSSPVIAVDHAACILCDRCVRACDDLQSNEVIGRTGKGHGSRIAFDLDTPMGESTCVACGECVASCPTGALTNKAITLPIVSRDDLEPVDSVCPYCGVGCAITYWVEPRVEGPASRVEGPRDDAIASVPSPSPSTLDPRPTAIVFAEGRESPVNDGRLCVKGRYGWDYALHPQRLTTPLIRREERYPKGPLSKEVETSLPGRPGGIVDYDEVLPAFREATWDEALDLIASRLGGIKTEHGPNALAGFGSAKCSNEEAYLFQKLVRAGFGTNNVDHCTRLCHASSVAALMETIGSGAVTNVFADVANADVALLTGSNAAANHPVAATFVKEAVKNGTQLIVVDVRRHPLADLATHFAQIRPGSDVAFYNGVMHVLVRDGLVDETFVADRTEGFEELRELIKEYPPEVAAEICGVTAEKIEAIARTIGGGDGGSERRGDAEAPGATVDPTIPASPRPSLSPSPTTARRTSPLPRMLVFWGMGISQHTHGTDNARCLISLCLMTGNVGKPGTGLHPLRGQNNVQGASDAGLIPMVYPDYQPVTDDAVREKFEAAWGTPLDAEPGLTVVEIVAGALAGSIRGMYVLGENPFVSDPNTNKVRKALANLDFLAVQDVFLTETAEFADVILPASSYFEKSGTYTNTDRRVQVGRPVLDLPGEARVDWEIVAEIGRRMGVEMPYETAADVFDEFAGLTKNYATLSHEGLGSTGKLWPCEDPATGDGTQILFGDAFPTANGRGRFVPCHFSPPHEPTDDEYPFVLSTGRLLEHWHTGSMTRRSKVLNTLEPTAFAALNPADLASLSIDIGSRVRLASRRGEIEVAVRADDTVDRGSVFVPFHFREAAANVLTTDALDPYGKIPEFKFCAIRVTLAENGS